MSGAALRRRRHRVDGGRHARGRRRHASRRSRAARRRAAARRRHHFRMQERLWADRRRRGPLAADRQGRHRRDDVSWRTRRSRGVPRRPRRPTSTWSPARCCRPARRTPAGWMCSAIAAPSMSTRPVTSSQPEWPPGSMRGCTPASSGPSAGIRLAVELGAASVDHCTYATDDDVEALAGAAGTTVATLLPGAEFSTRARYPDGRRLVDAGATVALATDCNPGSSFTTSMPFCIAVAVRDMNFTPAQALMGHDRRRGGGTAPRRRRGPHRRAAGGLRSAGRPVVRAPRVPARCAAGS